MIKRSKVFVVSMIFVILGFIYYIGILAPYNISGVLNPKGLGLIVQNSFIEIKGIAQYFEGYKIKKVKYLGTNTYEVFTEKGEFIVLADYSDNMYWKYKIFKYDEKVQYFTNPM